MKGRNAINWPITIFKGVQYPKPSGYFEILPHPNQIGKHQEILQVFEGM